MVDTVLEVGSVWARKKVKQCGGTLNGEYVGEVKNLQREDNGRE